MFYVKMNLTENVEIKTYITDENVFTVCPICGKEIDVDLAEVFEGGGDLHGTAIYCKECSETQKEGNHENSN